MTKNQLRKEYRLLRQKLLAENQKLIEEKIINNLLPMLVGRNKIALFYPKIDEISLLGLGERLPEQTFLLPRLRPKDKIMDFCKSDLQQQNLFLHQQYQIYEPHVTCGTLLPDVILVPLLAFDKNNHRLGYGGGYYDATIAYLDSINHAFLAIGVAHSELEVTGGIPSYKTDMALDYIVTEEQCNPNSGRAFRK
jgi:5-formyltetrahydrofolate cyclo-ligase